MMTERGKYAGTKGIGYWINSAWYSVRLDLDAPEASLKFHHGYDFLASHYFAEKLWMLKRYDSCLPLA